MATDQLVEHISLREPGIDRQRIRDLLTLCQGLDAGLVAAHFTRVRNLSRYLRDFPPSQIVEHLQLLSRLSDQELVVVSLRKAGQPGDLELLVAGVDLVGVSACITGCLAELSLQIVQMDVVTYEPPVAAEEPPEDEAESPSATTNRYVMSFRITGCRPGLDSDALSATIRYRLKAAYWHLVRGDFHKARHESDDQDELVGQLIDDRFRLERFLGQGGMGAIYLATQLDLQRPVAIKILRPEWTEDAGFVESFQREANLLAQVHSAQVVHVYAAGLFRQRCWMALEFLAGGDVGCWLNHHGIPSNRLAARWLAEALEGLDYVHRRAGMVHGDIKPNNLLLDAAQNLKLGDLGLSQLYHLARILRPDGSIRGTLWYMSPEQAEAGRTDQRSDLFSLGTTFYHILSARRPFEGATAAEVLSLVRRGEHTPLAEIAPSVPTALATVVERLMQPHPLGRYQDARVALEDLNSYLVRDRLGNIAPIPVCAAPQESSEGNTSHQWPKTDTG